ncbi:LysR family transcriptional regulator [uncultured Roseobacter sp.]|uniref:LysR family transcriptional regulator n=1 Tax=uncultured Roseobacter sp. TaxID=114847 RepID=UPI00261959B2|nr:LysR family transcriptional regulator [uncultured Roseobacter sp.]
MPRPTVKRELSLRWLDLFQICAQKGSLQAAAKETGLTVSTVSHHLRSLEDHLGVELFNHTRRPMVLTPKGRVFLRSIDEALFMIRKAKAEASAGTLAEASLLRIGTIEDFDSDITPEIAVYLSRNMPGCHFTYQTDSSHTIIDMLRNRHLDLGIASAPHEHFRDLQDRLILSDPFVIVLPRVTQRPLSDIVKGQGDLPFLRFSSDLLIAKQIESQMRRVGLSPTSSFECSNNQTLMAMVAAGAGWTITTPLLFARAKRFQSKLAMHKFPGKSFSRTLSIIATPDCSRSVLDLVDAKLRALISKYAISDQTRNNPWLADSFKLIG